MSKQNIEKMCQKFQRRIQKVVDESNGITDISIVIEGEKYVIAEKKEDEDNGK